MYRDRRQDIALEMERNYGAAKQSQVRPSNQLLLSFPPFPVRHPGADHGILQGCTKKLFLGSEKCPRSFQLFMTDRKAVCWQAAFSEFAIIPPPPFSEPRTSLFVHPCTSRSRSRLRPRVGPCCTDVNKKPHYLLFKYLPCFRSRFRFPPAVHISL